MQKKQLDWGMLIPMLGVAALLLLLSLCTFSHKVP